MSVAQSRAEAVWQGDLIHGSGEVVSSSGAFGALPLTWATRTKRVTGKTSPEELLAAAQAGCYAMALSNVLAKRGVPATRLRVEATCAFEVSEAGPKVSDMRINVKGQVPGMDQQTFLEVAREAEKGCPVANALRGNVPIQVTAQLEGSEQ